MRSVWRSRSVFVMAAVLLVTGSLASFGGLSALEAQESPMIFVIPEDNSVYGHGWTPGSTVTVTVDDTDLEMATVVFTDWEHEWLGRGDFELGEVDFDFQAGQTVRVSSDDDPPLQRVHTVTALRVTEVDLEGGTVEGTTDSAAGSVVEVVLHDAPARRWAEVQEGGTWVADFSASVEDGGEGWGAPFDLGLSEGGHVSEFDIEGDATSVNWVTAGTVVVNKIVEGDGPIEPFVFALICTRDGEPGTDLDLYATAGGSDSAQVVAGEVCTVDEFAIQIGEGTTEEDRGPIGTDEVRWDVDPAPPGFEGEGTTTLPFTVVANATVTITFTNTYGSGSVVVNKVIEGDGPTEPFVFALICSRDGEPGTDVDLYAPHGGPDRADVRVGEVCTVTEFALQIGEDTVEEDRGPIGTDDVVWSIAEAASGTGQQTDTFTVGDGEVVEVTFTNTYPPRGFPDVPEDFVHAEGIAWLVSQGITTGRVDGTFGPGDPVTRGQMASFLDRALGLDDAEDPSGFPDVPDGFVHAGAIDRLVAAGITTGREDGTFGPGDAVTRGQMATFLFRALS